MKSLVPVSTAAAFLLISAPAFADPASDAVAAANANAALTAQQATQQAVQNALVFQQQGYQNAVEGYHFVQAGGGIYPYCIQYNTCSRRIQYYAGVPGNAIPTNILAPLFGGEGSCPPGDTSCAGAQQQAAAGRYEAARSRHAAHRYRHRRKARY